MYGIFWGNICICQYGLPIFFPRDFNTAQFSTTAQPSRCSTTGFSLLDIPNCLYTQINLPLSPKSGGLDWIESESHQSHQEAPLLSVAFYKPKPHWPIICIELFQYSSCLTCTPEWPHITVPLYVRTLP